MMKKYFAIAKAVMLFWVLSSCSRTSPDTSSSQMPPPETLVKLTAEQMKSAGIVTGKPQIIELSENIQVSGKLDVPPQNMVTLSAMLGGFVKETDMLQGMHVKKGQILAVMEHPSYIELQQQFLEAAGKVVYAEKELSRQQLLSKDSVNAKKTLQLATAEFEMAKANYDALRAKLELINLNPNAIREQGIQRTIKLYAPIQGYITQVYVNVGAYVQPNNPLFKIVDTEHLHAEVIVYEKDINKLKIGQKIRIRLNNEQTVRMGTVYLIGKEIDEDRTVRVHGHLDKEDSQLLPGMYFTAEVLTDPREAMVLPEEAILPFDGKQYVFVLNPDNSFEMTEVRTGGTDNGNTEIIAPASLNGATFVLKGAYNLLAYLKNTSEE